MNYFSVDPLKQKVACLLREGAPRPLEHARLSFGSRNDYERLNREIAQRGASSFRVPLIDFTPLTRLANTKLLTDALEEASKSGAVVLQVREGPLVEQLRGSELRGRYGIAVYDSNGGFVGAEYSPARDELVDGLLALLREDQNYRKSRLRISNSMLLKLLHGSVTFPFPGQDIATEMLVDCDGRRYLRMPNGMLVSCFINIKKALSGSREMLEVAYEVVLQLLHEFLFGREESQSVDLLVVPNHSALAIAGAVQRIAGLSVCIVDKLGPTPRAVRSSDQLSIDPAGLSVALLVELSATGGEIDRSLLFLRSAGAVVREVIACWNLEVGKPLLVESESDVVSLCTPKRELGYVYRSK